MATPYDNTDGGKSYTRDERRIAADYGVDLDAPEQVRCLSCNKLIEAEDRNESGDCPTCATEIHAQECAAFITAPTLAGCKALMGVSR